jgi:hypothetical protein
MPDKTRLTLRLPPALYADAVRIADAQGISLNAFLTLGVRNWVSYQGRGMQALTRPAPPAVEAPTQQGERGKVARNDPCPCGSGRKFKHCHGKG